MATIVHRFSGLRRWCNFSHLLASYRMSRLNFDDFDTKVAFHACIRRLPFHWTSTERPEKLQGWCKNKCQKLVNMRSFAWFQMVFHWGVRLLTSFARLLFWNCFKHSLGKFGERLSIPTRKELEEAQSSPKRQLGFYVAQITLDRPFAHEVQVAKAPLVPMSQPQKWALQAETSQLPPSTSI